MLPSPAPDSCVLVLVRHGATSANLAVPHVLQGCGLDLSLCDVGVRQAEQVAEFLATQFTGEPSPALFSSELKRAVETAERIAAKLCRLSLRERTRLVDAESQSGGCPAEDAPVRGAKGDIGITTVAQLHEVDVGRWEGRDWGEIIANDPVGHRQFMEFPDTCGYPGGETITQVADRVQPVFEALAEQHLGQRVIVVAHNIILRAYLARLLGIPLRNYRVLTQENCCVNVLVWQAGAMTVRTMNSVWHIR
jgi:broad specificity phosphatase PhoE